jgi:hypothetical protein
MQSEADRGKQEVHEGRLFTPRDDDSPANYIPPE